MVRTLFTIATLIATAFAYSQTVTISGTAADSSNGAFVVEIVVNDTLAKIMKDPKNGRLRYLKLYQDPRIVTRTDTTGIFKIDAKLTDSLYFKSYQHVTQRHLVKDLVSRKEISIRLKPATITE